ncbi:glycosyltransferase family 4 protein [Allofournierella massiliensis]|uniref:Glycosyltransferase family 4 protein n=1 Tax=Allofournierella massiliensis TaxID=1650663 RepID=A0ABT7UPD2_9FIRM|nr:glycosyltransferase family 4 protein [Fournierella massiliensis]MDM8200741.1 glycosyltransferase family 4 protein [Fournierella massiliensis]
MSQLQKGRKVIFVANTARFFVMFEQNNIRLLQSMGYEVHCASNFEHERDVDAKSILEKLNVTIHQIDIARSPFSVRNLNAYRQLKALMKQERFDLVDCHTPMGGVLARLAAKATKTAPVLYTAHGFHFYKGCPLQNRLIYETIERWLARYTDGLITINEEDYQAAKSFHLRGKAYKIPGVGIDVKGIHDLKVDRAQKRRELGVPEDAFVMLSVGDLIPRKNHIVALRAFAQANIPNSYYLLCGNGELKEMLQEESRKLNVADRVIFLGFRSDVREILHAVDLFCFPSLQEGLPVSLMEAMAAGVPCIASRIRGNVDLMENDDLLFEAVNVGEVQQRIEQFSLHASELEKNNESIVNYSAEKVTDKMREVYNVMSSR